MSLLLFGGDGGLDVSGTNTAIERLLSSIDPEDRLTLATLAWHLIAGVEFQKSDEELLRGFERRWRESSAAELTSAVSEAVDPAELTALSRSLIAAGRDPESTVEVLVGEVAEGTESEVAVNWAATAMLMVGVFLATSASLEFLAGSEDRAHAFGLLLALLLGLQQLWSRASSSRGRHQATAAVTGRSLTRHNRRYRRYRIEHPISPALSRKSGDNQA